MKKRIKNILKPILCIICISAMLLHAGCTKSPVLPENGTETPETSGAAQVKKYYKDDVEHFDIPLEERSRNSFDKEAFESALNEFKEITNAGYTKENESRLLELYDQIKGHILDIKTDESLAKYDYYRDVKNTEKTEAKTSKNSEYETVHGKSVYWFRQALSTEYADAFRAHIGDWLAGKFENAAEVTSEKTELTQKIEGLNDKYDSLMAEKADAGTLKELYIEIVNANNEYARFLGYDNYAEYAYSKVYLRDYTIEDVKAAEDEILNAFVPLYNDYADHVIEEEIIYDVYDENYDSGEEKLLRIKECIKNISPEMVEALDHMIKNGLYDLEYSDAKIYTSAFNLQLYGYNDSLIFALPANKVSDYRTVLHEFGHYNYYYHRTSEPFELKTITDVDEIMAEGLELLCYDFYDDLSEEYGPALAAQALYQRMTSVRDGFAVNEAEYLTYTEPELTLEKLDEIWQETYDKYDMYLDYDHDSWTKISHVFKKPFYYISYAASSLVALEIFMEARSDFDSARDRYMTVTTLPAGTNFVETLNTVGIKNIFEQGTITALSESLAYELGF